MKKIKETTVEKVEAGCRTYMMVINLSKRKTQTCSYNINRRENGEWAIDLSEAQNMQNLTEAELVSMLDVLKAHKMASPRE